MAGQGNHNPLFAGGEERSCIAGFSCEFTWVICIDNRKLIHITPKQSLYNWQVSLGNIGPWHAILSDANEKKIIMKKKRPTHTWVKADYFVLC